MTKNDICSICLNDLSDNIHVLSPCNHKFHTKCLINSLRKCGPKCPNCRGLDKNLTLSNPNQITNNNFQNGEYIRVNRFNTGWVSNLDLDFDDDLFDSITDEELNRIVIHDNEQGYELDASNIFFIDE